MMDIVTAENGGRQVAVDPEPRDWGFWDDVRQELWTPIPEQRTATARWGRAVLIIAALSTLSWIALILLVIAAISYL
jgi:hypothetical protein